MVKNLPIFCILFLLSCAQNKEVADLDLKSIETVEYAGDSTELTELHKEIIYENGIEALTLESLVIKRFDDSKNLVEEITYNLYDRDTVKWRHIIQHFDALGNLISRTDSIDNTLRQLQNNEYSAKLLVKQADLNIFPARDESTSKSADSIYHVSQYFYDSSSRKIKSVTATWDNSISKLKETFAPDSSIQLYSYDSRGNATQMISIANSDTIYITNYITKNEFDSNGRQVLSASISDLSGTTKHVQKYDSQGNLVVEEIDTDMVRERIKYKYDAYNRVVESRVYKK